MKKLILLLTVLLHFMAAVAQPVTTGTPNEPEAIQTPTVVAPQGGSLVNTGLVNLVRTYVPQLPVKDLSTGVLTLGSSAGVTNAAVSTEFLDGLGRTLQKNLYRHSSSSNTTDIIVHYLYDLADARLESAPYKKSFLSNGGRLDYDYNYNIGQHYNKSDQQPPYSLLETDESPLKRPARSYAPGLNWYGSYRGSTVQYNINPAPVSLWQSDLIPVFEIDVTGINDLPITDRNYSATELFLTTMTDEDGHKVTEYKDKTGRLIAKRTADLTNTTGQSAYQITFYVYDNMGRLRTVIPPAAYHAMVANNNVMSLSIADGLCYRYWYDSRGRNIEKKMPGKGVEYTIFDDQDRAVFYRDSLAKTKGQWMFTVFDVLNRPVATGLYASGQNSTQLLADLNSPVAATGSLIDYLQNYHLFHDQFVPNGPGVIQLTATYYDDYNYSGTPLSYTQFDNTEAAYLVGQAPYALPVAAESKRTNGLVTGSATRVMNPDGTYGSWLTTVNFYDERGRLIQQRAENLVGGVDITTTQYHFAGQIASQVISHQNPSAVQPAHQNTRITKKIQIQPLTGSEKSLSMRINAGTWRDLHRFYPDETGKIGLKKIGDFEEKYTYNVRGWLTGINPEYVTNGVATNLGPFFGETLSYDQGFVTKLYSGNIAGMQWRGAGGAPKQFYGYSYDNLSRLTKAHYAKWEVPAAGGPAQWTRDFTDFSVPYVQYDLNGNILGMGQQGPTLSGSNNATIVPGVMDDMTYTYASNSNRLNSVQDASTAVPVAGTPDLRDGNTSGFDYDYDANGNLNRDLNKGIADYIVYNHFNKPVKIMVSGLGTIEYTYDGNGNRLRKTVAPAGSPPTEIWDYIGAFVYQNNALQYILNEEGRCRPDASDPTLFTYDYFIKDHLQNVRAVVGTNPVAVYGGTAAPPIRIRDYKATMEVSVANTESLLWDRLNEVRDLNPNSVDPNDTRSALLDANDPDRRVGTAIMLRVMPGDKFDITSRSYYDAPPQTDPDLTTSDLVGTLLNTLSGGVAGAGSVPVSELPRNQQILQGAFGSNSAFAGMLDGLQSDIADPGKPQSFLNYAVLDENLRMVADKSGALQADGGAGTWVTRALSGPVDIEQAGYLVVFTSSAAKGAVYWDQLVLTKWEGEVQEEDHYYPFGLTLSANGLDPIAENRYKLTTKELEKNLGLNIYDFGARSYDMQIGRWWQHDPLSSDYLDVSPYNYVHNNPTQRIDPTGMGDDWVQDAQGNIRWDKEATSEATTKAGETYLGKDLKFVFNSYIDKNLWDGPLGSFPAGDKLTSTINVKSNTDAENNLISVDITSDKVVHKTGGIFQGDGFYPGLRNRMIKHSGATSGVAVFEQHAKVNSFEEMGLSAMWFDVVNVAQQLTLRLNGNSLSVTAATDIFPSATLSVNNHQLFKYDQPSFSKTHGRVISGYREPMNRSDDGLIPIFKSQKPAPTFYQRYNK